MSYELPIVELIRLENHPDFGTIGVLKVAKQLFCVTLELPNKQNATNVSCIPTGQYYCRRYDSPNFGATFRVDQVPGRTQILFHAGNTFADTAGCILLGEKAGKLKTYERAVLNSGATFSDFMKRMISVDLFHLTITECF